MSENFSYFDGYKPVTIEVYWLNQSWWWNLDSICRLFDITPESVLKRLDKREYFKPKPESSHTVIYLNLQGLMRVIYRTKSPSAQRFQAFVFESMLPELSLLASRKEQIDEVNAALSRVEAATVDQLEVLSLQVAALSEKIEAIAPQRSASGDQAPKQVSPNVLCERYEKELTWFERQLNHSNSLNAALIGAATTPFEQMPEIPSQNGKLHAPNFHSLWNGEQK